MVNQNVKKGFLIVAHGSKKDIANQRVFALTKRLCTYFQTDMFEPALMEMAKPSIPDGIKSLFDKGMENLIVFPFFLFKGMHFSKDVPALIEKTLDQLAFKIPYTMLEPIGMHPDIFNMVQEMLYNEVMDESAIKNVAPTAIEDKSMEIIDEYIEGKIIKNEERPIIKRVIHTTGDFDFLSSMLFQNKAVMNGINAIREQKTIFTDVTMIQAGINKKHNHHVLCIINDSEVEKKSQEEKITRAAAGIRHLGRKLNGNIVVIGNAPTALISLVDLIISDNIKPALIIGIPVGFVNAKESKKYLTKLEETPYITNRGHKGGSTVAVAIVNALMKMTFK